MIPEYVQKIKDWPVPKSGKEVATFLGFAGYYCTFILQHSVLTNQLNGTKKVEKFFCNKEMEQDFIELKKAFTEGGIQAFPGSTGEIPWVLGKSVTSTREITLVTKENC